MALRTVPCEVLVGETYEPCTLDGTECSTCGEGVCPAHAQQHTERHADDDEAPEPLGR